MDQWKKCEAENSVDTALAGLNKHRTLLTRSGNAQARSAQQVGKLRQGIGSVLSRFAGTDTFDYALNQVDSFLTPEVVKKIQAVQNKAKKTLKRLHRLDARTHSSAFKRAMISPARQFAVAKALLKADQDIKAQIAASAAARQPNPADDVLPEDLAPAEPLSPEEQAQIDAIDSMTDEEFEAFIAGL